MKISYHGQEGDKLLVKIDAGEPMLLTIDDLYRLANIDEKLAKEELDWQSLRNQAAIAAMQGFLSRQTYRADLATLAKDSVRLANCLIEELKKK